MDPNAGGVAGSTSPPNDADAATGEHAFRLAQAVTHHDACPGNYIMGQVLNGQGGPMAGVHIVMLDQWGNRADAMSKAGENDYGLFDLPLNGFANQYTLTVVDGEGRPLSAPVVIDHLQGGSGNAPCHTVVWQGG
jgi:hypothetical protein